MGNKRACACIKVEDDGILRLAGMLPYEEEVATKATRPLLQMSDAELQRIIGCHAAEPEAQQAGANATQDGVSVIPSCAHDRGTSRMGCSVS